jgi:hypothetical protein
MQGASYGMIRHLAKRKSEVNTMKKNRMVFGIVIALVIVVAVLVGIWYKTPVALVTQNDDTAFTVSNICTGAETDDISDQVDLAALTEVIAGYTGVREFPNQRSQIVWTDDMIEIDGNDANGAVHLVLTESEGFLYRSGISNCVVIPQYSELYQEVSALIS